MDHLTDPYVPDESLPPTVLCDIDGTVAHMHDRGPYEWDRVGEDTVDEYVRMMLRAFKETHGWRIVLLSGRSDICRRQTSIWLALNEVPFDDLHMRTEGDYRPDDVVKAELFDKYVRPHCWARLVLDDRDSPVALWRTTLGLPCWQVAYGNF